ncbi:glycosyltransferase [Brevibacterium album]|uniref:glycosyltransferase n=1 Tax=Brevibacterium album TaxID=417948 RepID=UPI0003FC2815|nr:glycosyltransferase [Brevibacterium album]
MRIGLLASTGGMLDAFFPEIAAAWEEAGHTVHTAAGDACAQMPGAVIGGLTRRPGLSSGRACRELRAWCGEQRLDVVVTSSATASALVRLSRLPAPVVYFCHGLHWNRLRTPQDHVWQLVEHQLLVRTAAVITINSDDEVWFRHRMPAHTVRRIRAGVGLDLRRYPRAPLPAGPLSLVWIGEHSSRKRPDQALETVRRLEAAGVDCELTMIGRGDLLERTRAQVRARGLSRSVHVAGWGDSAQALAGAHALVHTARWEGLPRVVLEAFAVGRPTYAFDVKGVRDAPGTVLVPDADAGALASAIRTDWESGLLHRALDDDPGFLGSEAVAAEILTFLAGSVVRREVGGQVPSAGGRGT